MITFRTTAIVLRGKIKQNPNVLYLFGDNLIRKGLGGQAKEMRGEPNTIGIVTKRYPSNHPTSFIYDSDKDIEDIKAIIDADINKVKSLLSTGKYKALVIPPIGVGLAKLPSNAPQLFKYLQDRLGEF